MSEEHILELLARNTKCLDRLTDFVADKRSCTNVREIEDIQKKVASVEYMTRYICIVVGVVLGLSIATSFQIQKIIEHQQPNNLNQNPEAINAAISEMPTAQRESLFASTEALSDCIAIPFASFALSSDCSVATDIATAMLSTACTKTSAVGIPFGSFSEKACTACRKGSNAFCIGILRVESIWSNFASIFPRVHQFREHRSNLHRSCRVYRQFPPTPFNFLNNENELCRQPDV